MRTHVTGTNATSDASSENHRVVSRDEWVAERKTLLAREKELTRLRDQVARERRALPWVRIDKTYVFDAAEGRPTLAELGHGDASKRQRRRVVTQGHPLQDAEQVTRGECPRGGRDQRVHGNPDTLVTLTTRYPTLSVS